MLIFVFISQGLTDRSVIGSLLPFQHLRIHLHTLAIASIRPCGMNLIPAINHQLIIVAEEKTTWKTITRIEGYIAHRLLPGKRFAPIARHSYKIFDLPTSWIVAIVEPSNIDLP